MNTLPKCPKCHSEYTYQDNKIFMCPECSHEWIDEIEQQIDENVPIVKDAHGNILQNNDTVIIIKDLKIKGSSSVIKVGTKVKNIRLIEGDHNIDCRVDGVGPMKLKSQFVKKC